MITAMEELALNAWPADQTLLYDGWVIRFAGGYTRRANSILPLYPSSLDLDEKLAFCEQVYRQQKLNPVFKLTPAACPANLDENLAAKGYRKDAQTSVQVLALETIKAQTAHGMEFQENLSDEWLDGFCGMSAVSKTHRQALQRILLNIIPRHCFASLKIDGKLVACGLGVLQAGHIGLFDIVTHEAFRGRGYGRQVVESLLDWGRHNGASHSYLQVMLNNPPALHLYAKIGFVETYQYWYRIKPKDG